MVKLKPIFAYHDGKMAMEMAITTSKAIQWVFDLTTKLAPLSKLSFVHMLAHPRVKESQTLMSGVARKSEDAMIREVTLSIGTHIGPEEAGVVVSA